jgi:hypothetical protein
MATRDYNRLSIEDFGDHLLTSGDLDPVYIALCRAEMPEDQLHRWLLAYWCCYHPGASSWLSELEGPAFWQGLYDAAWNEKPAPVGGRWPRAPERRHWRAKNAILCVDDLHKRYSTASDFVRYCYGSPLEGVGIPLRYVTERVQQHVGFGPWIAFKVADMMERVCDIPIDFRLNDIMYKDPEEAAARLWLQRSGFADGVRILDRPKAVRQAVEYLVGRFHRYDAPGGRVRPVGFQEVETILCKWKSHVNGHYPLNNDLVEIRAGAEPWAKVSKTAEAFLHHLPLPMWEVRG